MKAPFLSFLKLLILYLILKKTIIIWIFYLFLFVGSQHLLNTIEVSRSCLSIIATQYNLNFSSEDYSSEIGSSKLQFYYSWANQKVFMMSPIVFIYYYYFFF